MFKIVKKVEGNLGFLVLKNDNETTKAIISLNEGGRLQSLKFNEISIIEDNQSLKYEDTFASSILFPFANRIDKGLYNFEGKDYKFTCNENGRNNALHGLVFDKKFEFVEENISLNSCSVTLTYQENKKNNDFPFLYKIDLTYKLTENGIGISVKVKNTDNNSFPFTLGWHPYFKSDNLYDSDLDFDSEKKISFNENLITTGIVNSKQKMPYKIKNSKLDDCFVLNSNKIKFSTPKYSLDIITNLKENYLQIYTPDNNKNVIAIEPMIGVSDSFNNKIGLQMLKPNEEFQINWDVNFLKI